MTMPTHPVRDVMARTIANLDFVRAHATDDGPYEVTQLVNSFLGALAHPWERLRRDVARESIASATERGWPRLEKERPEDVEPRDLADLLRLVRNAFAHGNIEYQSENGRDITHVRIWNERHGRRTWGTRLDIDTLRTFLERFSEMALHFAEAWPDATDNRR